MFHYERVPPFQYVGSRYTVLRNILNNPNQEKADTVEKNKAIENFTKKLNEIEVENFSCDICLESSKKLVEPCGQCKFISHRKCIKKWLLINLTCPMCRFVIKI